MTFEVVCKEVGSGFSMTGYFSARALAFMALIISLSLSFSFSSSSRFDNFFFFCSKSSRSDSGSGVIVRFFEPYTLTFSFFGDEAFCVTEFGVTELEDEGFKELCGDKFTGDESPSTLEIDRSVRDFCSTARRRPRFGEVVGVLPAAVLSVVWPKYFLTFSHGFSFSQAKQTIFQLGFSKVQYGHSQDLNTESAILTWVFTSPSFEVDVEFLRVAIGDVGVPALELEPLRLPLPPR